MTARARQGAVLVLADHFGAARVRQGVTQILWGISSTAVANQYFVSVLLRKLNRRLTGTIS